MARISEQEFENGFKKSFQLISLNWKNFKKHSKSLRVFFLFCCLILPLSELHSQAGEISPIDSVQPIEPPKRPALIGAWQFTKIRYQGKEMPIPNPNLVLTYDFYEDGLDRLYWSRTDETGFCERTARFQFGPDYFRELIIWVNPKNRFDCGQDPDMQMGHQSFVDYRMIEGRMEIDIQLGDGFITYIWTRR